LASATSAGADDDEAFDIVNNNENIQEMLDQLRDQHIVYKEAKNRCKVELGKK
jgi:hypothetical protein